MRVLDSTSRVNPDGRIDGVALSERRVVFRDVEPSLVDYRVLRAMRDEAHVESGVRRVERFGIPQDDVVETVTGGFDGDVDNEVGIEPVFAGVVVHGGLLGDESRAFIQYGVVAGDFSAAVDIAVVADVSLEARWLKHNALSGGSRRCAALDVDNDS